MSATAVGYRRLRDTATRTDTEYERQRDESDRSVRVGADATTVVFGADP